MDIRQQVALQSFNTLALAATAEYFVQVETDAQLCAAWQWAHDKNLPVLVLGQGSNIVLKSDVSGLVIQNAIAGFDILEETDTAVVLEIGAGENWHALVERCVCAGYYGIENLALIPGTVGAAPVQNIGAYGVEIALFILHVKAFDTQTGQWHSFTNPECTFAYRDSLFKQTAGRYLISHIALQLHKTPTANIRYDALRTHFGERGVHTITPQQVMDAVVQIRRSRLPDPAVLPNAGSFFKNPVVSAAHYRKLQEQFPQVVAYPVANSTDMKLAAAWLIDRAGWKGKRSGHVGVHAQQALVLVNHGGADGGELLALADDIRRDIRSRYDVELEIEPVVIGR